MKKFIIRLVLTALAILFTSCSDDVKPQTDISEKFYYLSSHVSYAKGSTTTLLHRFNVENGQMTPLCPDPLCEHSAEVGCAFSGLINYTVDGDTIWFNRMFHTDEGTVNAICRYDIADGKLRVLAEYDEDGYSYVFRFGYLWKYFTHSDPTEDDISVRISLTKENFGDPEEIDPGKNPFAQDGDVYYYAAYGPYHSPATEIYAMRTDLSEEWLVADDVFSMEFKYYRGYVYYIENGTLMRVSVDEDITGTPINTKETVKGAVGGFFFHEDHLFYLQCEEDPGIIGWDEFLEEEVENVYGGKVWRSKLDGSRAKVFVETDGYVISSSQLWNAQVGDKIVLRYGCWKDKKRDGETLRAWRAAEGGLMVVNLDKGGFTAYSVWDEE